MENEDQRATLPESRIRWSFEDSWARLREQGLIATEATPYRPPQLPRHDDEQLGLSFYKTCVAGRFHDLTIPRTFFGRSEIRDAWFENTDLSESNLCWNDFLDVSFRNATLTGSDLRASSFRRVTFAGADLSRVDLRGSTFLECDFSDARLDGAIAVRRPWLAWIRSLNRTQKRRMIWRWTRGEDPGGG